MDMCFRTAAAVIVITFVCALPARAQQFPAQMLGAWQLNLDKSAYDPGPAPFPPATNITTLERVNGGVRMTVDNVNGEGARNHTVTLITLDGKPQPIEGLQGVTRSFKLIDPRTLEWTQQAENRPPSTTRVVLGSDGKTLSVTASSNKNKLVFDKKP